MIGDFTWAGYDYLGEAGCGIFHYDGGANFSSIYPERTAYIGDLDLLGNRRPISYLREIVYGLRKTPYLAVLRMEHNGQTSSKTPWMFKDNLSSWTWPGFEGQTASVDVYSASEEVELFLNGASLGRRTVVDFTATYSVPYTPGELKAVGYTGSVCDGEFTLRTAQDAQMTLTADRKTLQANGEDAAFVMIQFVDANDTADLHTKHTLKVELEGAGILEAVSAVKDVAAGDAGMFPGWGPTIAAAIVAFVVGYVVIIGFLKFVSTFSYKAFAIYRIGLAIVVALLLITGVLSPLEAAAAA